MNIRVFYFIPVFIYCFIYCRAEKDGAFSSVNEAGVRIVVNSGPLWDKNNHKIDIRYAGKIGDIEAEDENYIFNFPIDIKADKNGNIYVLDNGSYRIKKFSSKGRFLKTIGRKGKGPNEIETAKSIAVSADNNIIVADWGNMAYKIFFENGDLIENYSLANENYQILLLDFDLFSNASMVLPKKNSDNLYMIMNFTGDTLFSYGKVKKYKEKNITGYKNLFRFCIGNNDEVFIAYSHENSIQKYSKNGVQELEIKRPVNYEPEIYLPGYEQKIVNGNLMIIRTEPNFGTVSNGIAIDSKQRIWILSVSRPVREEEIPKIVYGLRGELANFHVNDETEAGLYKFDIFSEYGKFLYEIPIPFYCDEFIISNNRIYLLDIYRTMCVYMYDILEI